METNQPDFKIEKRKPIPKIVRTGRPEKYPWSKMEVGDSFFRAGKAPALQMAAYDAAKRHGHKYTCRTVDGGGRVWRIK